MATSNYVLLQRTTVAAGYAPSSITFSGLPATGYTDLKIVLSGQVGSGSGNAYGLRFNSGSGASDYSAKVLRGSGSVSSYTYTSSVMFESKMPSTSDGAYFSYDEIIIPKYNVAGFNKTAHLDNTYDKNEANYDSYLSMQDGRWTGTGAITSVTIQPTSAWYFAPLTVVDIYGLSAVGQTPISTPKATGGDIVVNDGTYWYHAFLSSGVFTPSQNLTCDTVVVAGGGGGLSSSNWNGYGGGGAGGLIYKYSSAITTGSYTVSIGAGGSSDASGTNSTFNSLIAYGGGKPDVAGGSGGGGSGRGTPAPAGGTSTQTSNNGGTGKGNAGGAAQPGDNGPYTNAGGGGGGAGGAGGNAGSPTYQGGAGGIGWTDSVINAMGAATNTGQLSGGNYYFAGGAGGVSTNNTNPSGGLGGGGKSDYSTSVAGSTVNAKTAGTANTGGGGGSAQYGGGGTDYSGKAGGSGIVIVRYPMA